MGGHPPACPCPSEDRPKQTESPGGRAGGASGTGRTQIASSTAPTSGRAATSFRGSCSVEDSSAVAEHGERNHQGEEEQVKEVVHERFLL